MAGTFSPHPEGGFLIQPPGLPPMRTAYDETRLRSMGYAPAPGLTDASRGALASNAPPPSAQSLGFGDSDREAADWIAQAPGREKVQSFLGDLKAEASGRSHAAPPPAQSRFAQMENLRPAPDDPAAKGGGKPLRGGGEVRQMDLGTGSGTQPSAPSARYVRTPARDQRVAFTVDKSPIAPEQLDQFNRDEESLLEQRKQAALGETAARVRSNAEASRDLGIGLIDEEAALREQERKNQAMTADYERRALAIDKERAAIEGLQAKPVELFGDGWGKALAAISVLAGGVLQGLKGGKNPALEALNDIIDRKTAEQKEVYERRQRGLAGKETDFERLVKIYGSPQAAESELRDRKRLYLQRFAEKKALDAGNAGASDALKLQFAAWDQERAGGVLDRQRELSDKVREQHQYIPESMYQVGGGGKPANEKDVHQYGRDLEAAGLGASEGEAGALRDLATQIPGDSSIPTFETRNIVSRGIRQAADTIGGQGTGQALLDTDAERGAVAALQRWSSQARSKVSGASLTEGEKADWQRRIDQVNTREGALAIARDLDRMNERRKTGIRAGIKPEAVQEYERRKLIYGQGIEPPRGLRRE